MDKRVQTMKVQTTKAQMTKVQGTNAIHVHFFNLESFREGEWGWMCAQDQAALMRWMHTERN